MYNYINRTFSDISGHTKPPFPGSTSVASTPSSTNGPQISSPQTSFSSHSSNQHPSSRLPTAFSIPNGGNIYGRNQRPGPSTGPSMMTTASRKEQSGHEPTMSKSLLPSPIDFHNLPKHWIWNTTSLLYASYASSEQLHRNNQEMHYPGSAFTSLRTTPTNHGSELGLIDGYKTSLLGPMSIMTAAGRDNVDLISTSNDSQTDNNTVMVSL